MKILTDAWTFPSAKLLRDSIVVLTNRNILVTKYPEKINAEDKFIRYGNSSITRSNTDFNSREFINFCASKLNFSRIMSEKGFIVPMFYKETPTEFPVMIRETLSGSGGKGIKLCKDLNEFKTLWRNIFWWTPFLKIQAEFRVHCLGGEVVKVFKKVRDEGLNEEEFPIRNLHRGYHFSLINNHPPKLIETVNRAKELLGKFCALDMGWIPDKKEYVFIESNSAPGLNENTANDYAKYLIKEMGL